MHLASTQGFHTIVEELISAGADIHARNSYLWTPLSCASACGWTKCGKLLLRAGASIETVDRNKNTPLHLASKHGHDSFVQLLIDNEADLTLLNLSDNNPLDEAIARGNRDAIIVFLSCDRWREALRKSKMTLTGCQDTPVKQLIKRHPDLAKIVLDRCITTNLHDNKIKNQNDKTVSLDSPDFKVKTFFTYFYDKK